MSEYVEAILLTKSAKHGQNCVAAIECRSNSLIRFVSDNEETHGALGDADMTCANGYVCQPLDKVRVPVLKRVPQLCQRENWLIDSGGRWELLESLPQEAALSLPGLMIMRGGRILGSRGNRVTKEFLPYKSLELNEVENLVISKEPEHKPKVNFTYNDLEYRHMSLTDRDYYGAADGTVIGRAVVLMSLPDVPYEKDGYYYKFVAKIFPLPPKG